ncbi:hypothetical protein [Flagellimonas amoyensis]|uniref:hypothetical protein n=1 Tax=Flagellimonas amoyensis TaxID=2169401 RepID=UPI00131F36B5|nr:hypothetical protein [Allomuricauda amoyensis]
METNKGKVISVEFKKDISTTSKTSDHFTNSPTINLNRRELDNMVNEVASLVKKRND